MSAKRRIPGGYRGYSREHIPGAKGERKELSGGRISEPLHALLSDRCKKHYVERYRKRCFVIGKDIYVLTPGEKKRAHVEDVDQSCHLVVQYEDGTIERLASGEISIRPVSSW